MSDLGQLAAVVHRYAKAHADIVPRHLPAEDGGGFLPSSRTDPVTGRAYQYHYLGPARYSLCAVFATATDAYFDAQWGQQPKHGRGRVCLQKQFAANDVSDTAL